MVTLFVARPKGRLGPTLSSGLDCVATGLGAALARMSPRKSVAKEKCRPSAEKGAEWRASQKATEKHGEREAKRWEKVEKEKEKEKLLPIDHDGKSAASLRDSL